MLSRHKQQAKFALVLGDVTGIPVGNKRVKLSVDHRRGARRYAAADGRVTSPRGPATFSGEGGGTEPLVFTCHLRSQGHRGGGFAPKVERVDHWTRTRDMPNTQPRPTRLMSALVWGCICPQSSDLAYHGRPLGFDGCFTTSSPRRFDGGHTCNDAILSPLTHDIWATGQLITTPTPPTHTARTCQAAFFLSHTTVLALGLPSLPTHPS